MEHGAEVSLEMAPEVELSRPGRRIVKDGHLRVALEPLEDGVGGTCSRDTWLRRVGNSVVGAGGEPE